MIKKKLHLWTLSFLVASPLWAQAKKTVVIAAPAWPLFTQIDGSGLYLDYFRAIFEPEGYQLKYVSCPVKRCNNMVESGEADLTLDLFINEIPGLDFPQVPSSVIRGVALSLADKAPWKGLESLRGQPVAWIRGYKIDSIIAVPMHWTEIDSIDEGLAMVKSHRITHYIDEESAIKRLVDKHTDKKTAFDTHLVYKIALFPGFSRKTPDGKTLLKTYEKKVSQILTSGQAKSLFEKWKKTQLYDDLREQLSKMPP